ncbi:MAG: hypothetical protein BWY82_01493 [Verrucomicrobia bacterium ADurb.Bin474]|nr:MAG: hypothetical protein BWY82_01493 [Verrucomicrobia bacterium ADurb.Bin474]
MKGFDQVCYIKNVVRNPKILIDLLQELRWWDWPIEKITDHLPILTSNDLTQLKGLVS